MCIVCHAIRDCFRVNDIESYCTRLMSVYLTGGFSLSTPYYHQSCYEESSTLCTLPEGAPQSQPSTHTLTSPASYTQHPRQTAGASHIDITTDTHAQCTTRELLQPFLIPYGEQPTLSKQQFIHGQRTTQNSITRKLAIQRS